MPTFSFPSETTTKDAPKATAKAKTTEKETPTPKASKTSTKRTSKKEKTATDKDEPTTHVVEEEPTQYHNNNQNVSEPEAEEEEEPEEETTREPTFPDVVILKQTDKNYIVKHNHYPLPVHETTTTTSTHDNVNAVTSIHTNTSGTTSSLTQSADLVSPNQIYKGQINKKRGRKPKAGFILNSNTGMYDTTEVPNIILHLKCHLSDLKINESISNYEYTPSISEVESYNLTSNLLQSSDLCQSYSPDDDDDDDEEPSHLDHLRTNKNTQQNNISISGMSISSSALASSSASGSASTSVPVVTPTLTTTASAKLASCDATSAATSASHHNSAFGCVSGTGKKVATESAVHVMNERHQKEIMKKINRLKYSFHNGETIQMKLNHKCACFWDTCEFDGPIYYIPIMIVNGVFHVSGCFCSPECALASLLKEQMDTSTKFERIHLLHLLYGNSNNKGFKPAPNPNYLLDKYYGNLTIDEYRSLLKGPQMIHIVNKPLTHILPELYEDNNDFLVNSKVIPTNNLKLKKRYKTTLVQSGGAD